MERIKDVLEMTALLCSLALTFSFIAWFLGYEGFIIIGHVELPMWLIHIIMFLSLTVHMSLYAGFVLSEYSFKVLTFSIPIAIVSFINDIFGNVVPPEIITGVIPMLIFGFALFMKRSGYSGFALLILFNILTIAFQYVLHVITTISLDARIGMYDMFRLSVSSLIFMGLIYCLGGVYHVRLSICRNELKWKYGARWLERMVFPDSGRPDPQRSEHEQKSTQSLQLGQTANARHVTKFELWLMRLVIAVVNIAQWLFILWVCSFDNLFLDGLVMTTSFICYGMVMFKYRKHLPIILCTLAATAMFYTAVRFTFSFQFSPFFPIIIGCFLCYAMYRVGHHMDMERRESQAKLRERIKKLEVKTDEAWQQLDQLSTRR